MDFKEIQCENVDWILVTQEVVQWWAFMGIVMNALVP
jgi:hypothetical protein